MKDIQKHVEAQADLLRCPFCGGEPEMLNGDGRWSQVGCKGCAASGPEFPENDAKAIQGWNRRTLAPAQAEGWQQVTRLEIIDEAGRCYTRWKCAIQPSVQDQGRTLKIFVSPPSAPDAEPE